MKIPTCRNLLCDLISIPSVNPELSNDNSVTGDAKIINYLSDYFKRLNADVKIEKINDKQSNIIAYFYDRKKIDNKRTRLIFAPHIDTVNVENMSIQPFNPLLKNGKIYGRGASDTKGSIACMLTAISKFLENKKHVDLDIAFIGIAGEESSQVGSRHFIKHHKNEHDFAIVGEPTNSKIVNSHKGCMWIEITTHGKSAHGSVPHEGKSAIKIMIEIIKELENQKKIWETRYLDKEMGKPTINIGKIISGTQPNIVPNICKIEIDLRYTPLFKKDDPIKIIDKIIKKIDPISEIKKINPASPPLFTPKSHPILQKISSNIKNIKYESASWFCDASILSHGGLDSVAIGPGSITQAHTDDEWISLDELEKSVDFYLNILNKI